MSKISETRFLSFYKIKMEDASPFPICENNDGNCADTFTDFNFVERDKLIGNFSQEKNILLI